MIVVAPVAFVLAAYGLPQKISWRESAEGAGFMVAALLAGLTLFGSVFPAWPALSILVIPLLLLVAFRFTIREVVFANMLVALGATIGVAPTLQHALPDALARGLLTLCLLLLVSSLTVQLLAALRVERNRKEAVLRAERQRLLDIIEFLPDATFIIDDQKRVTAWNHAMETMTGVRKEEVMGRGDYAYATPFFGAPCPILIDLLDMSSPEIEARYKYVKRAGDKVFAESLVPRLNGGIGAYLWGVAAPLRDRDGCRFGAIECISRGDRGKARRAGATR